MRSGIDRAPLYEMLEKHAALGHHSFHIPGHKQTAVWRHEAAERRYSSLLPLDLTELADTDDLHHPSGGIAEAQRLAAECFGAGESRFLAGGSTAGNLAMILGVTEPGDLLIVQRNVHKSVIHGLMLAGARAVLLPPRVEPSSGLAVMPAAADVAGAIARYPEAKAVVVSTPNYYGIGADVEPIVSLCRSAGIPLLVDEAHGPHFGFHPAFPPSALQAGADVVVQSAHKMLSAMTMTAMLHMRPGLAARESIDAALRMVQSSSPSFPLLASLDLARRQLHLQGADAFEPALEAVRIAKEALPGTPLRALEPDAVRSAGFRLDPLKLALYDASGRRSGFEIRDRLAAKGCIAEMADDRFAVLAFGVGSRKPDGEALAQALKEWDADEDGARGERQSANLSAMTPYVDPVIPEPVAFRRNHPKSVRIPLERSLGRTAGEWVIPYPPGIPELFPGEMITETVLERLKRWSGKGAVVQGAEDPGLQFIRVWQTEEIL